MNDHIDIRVGAWAKRGSHITTLIHGRWRASGRHVMTIAAMSRAETQLPSDLQTEIVSARVNDAIASLHRQQP